MDNWLHFSWVYENSCTKLTKLKCSALCGEGSTSLFLPSFLLLSPVPLSPYFISSFLPYPPLSTFLIFTFPITFIATMSLVNQSCTEVTLLMIGTCEGEKTAPFHLFFSHSYPVQLYIGAKLFLVINNKVQGRYQLSGIFFGHMPSYIRYQRQRVIIYPQSQDKNLACL